MPCALYLQSKLSIPLHLLGSMLPSLSLAALAAVVPFAGAATSTQTYNWKSVKIGGGGGFVPGMATNKGGALVF
jgi:hypothetical protein